jgi:hypothetical protein
MKVSLRLLKSYAELALVLFVVALTAFPNASELSAQNAPAKSAIKLARVKYSGGGDWYNDPSSEVNLLRYVNKTTNIIVDPVYEFVDIAGDNLFAYPMIFMTGHGNLKLSDVEIQKLRSYLKNGGFLYIDDDYGFDEFVRKEMKRVFPEQEMVELPFSYGIYSCHFKFPNGLPKIHEHDNKPPRGLGLFSEGRLCVFYTYETNLADGWADPDVHQDSQAVREEALKMGVNIIVWALTH